MARSLQPTENIKKHYYEKPTIQGHVASIEQDPKHKGNNISPFFTFSNINHEKQAEKNKQRFCRYLLYCTWHYLNIIYNTNLVSMDKLISGQDVTVILKQGGVNTKTKCRVVAVNDFSASLLPLNPSDSPTEIYLEFHPFIPFKDSP